MNNPATYPYSLEVQPCDKPAGHFLWTIREDGRLLERAMRAVPTREEAENTGMKAVERMLQGASQPRGRSRWPLIANQLAKFIVNVASGE
jgi:hypothetical protein